MTVSLSSTLITSTLKILLTSAKLKSLIKLLRIPQLCYGNALLLLRPSTYTLRPITMNNACPLCFAATAGTELVGANPLENHYFFNL